MRLMALFTVALMTATNAAASGDGPLRFIDPNLKAAVEKQLGVREPNTTDMLKLTELAANKQDIVDLSGLEHARHLKILYLNGNRISDISVLAGLAGLEYVDLANNRINNVLKLSALKKLNWLILYNNRFEDIPATRRTIDLERAVVVMYEGNRDPDITAPALETAIARADNDYAYEEPYRDKASKSVPLPGPVREKICQVTLENFLNTFYEGIEPQKYSGLFGPVFRIRIPESDSLHLYVYVLKGIGVVSDTFCLILHDIQTDKVTEEPRCFYGRWMYGRWPWIPIGKPFVGFDDLNLDGNPEVVFKERIHNGTVLNAIVHHFLHIGGDLSLVPIFRLEARSSHDFFNEGRPGYLVRTIEKLKPNRILLSVTVSADPFESGSKKIGSVILESSGPSSPFEAKQKVMHPDRQHSGRWHVTYEKLLLHTWLSPYR